MILCFLRAFFVFINFLTFFQILKSTVFNIFENFQDQIDALGITESESVCRFDGVPLVRDLTSEDSNFYFLSFRR
jgi:hypothetical protein